jgi:hypothetical protein
MKPVMTPELRVFADACKADGSFGYLATPYSKYEDGLEAAFIAACRIAGWLISNGIPCHSPIAETHAVAIHSGLDPRDHGIWLKADEPLMDAAFGLIVAKLPGWEDSYGVKVERARFRVLGKPVVFLEVAE